MALSLALLIGLSLPVINLAFPQKYTSGDKLQVFKRLPIEKIKNITGANLLFLGDIPTCAEARREARKHYPNVDGCYYCCFPCNKKDRNLKKSNI